MESFTICMTAPEMELGAYMVIGSGTMANTCTTCNGSGFTEVTYRFIKAELPCSECNQEEIAKRKAESEIRLDAERVSKQAVHKWNEIVKPVYRELYAYGFTDEAINQRGKLTDTKTQLEIMEARYERTPSPSMRSDMEEARRKYIEASKNTTSMHMLFFLSTELQYELDYLRKGFKKDRIEESIAALENIYEKAKTLVAKAMNERG